MLSEQKIRKLYTSAVQNAGEEEVRRGSLSASHYAVKAYDLGHILGLAESKVTADIAKVRSKEISRINRMM